MKGLSRGGTRVPLSRVRERDRVRVSENDAPPQPRFAEESSQGEGE